MDKFKQLIQKDIYLKASIVVIINVAIIFFLYNIIRFVPDALQAIIALLKSLFSAALPVLGGLVIAYAVSPAVSFIDEHLVRRLFLSRCNSSELSKEKILQSNFLCRKSRLFSAILTYILILIFLAIFVYFFVVMMIGGFTLSNIKETIMNLYSHMMYLNSKATLLLNSFAGGAFSNLPAKLLSSFNPQMVISGATDIFNFFASLFIAIVVSLYIISDSYSFKRLWRKALHILLPQKANALLTETLREINLVLAKFIKGAFIDGLIVAFISSLVLSLLKIEFAIFVGIFAGVVNIIPYFGPFITMIPAFILGYDHGGFSYGLLTILVLFIIQQIDGDIIYPKVVGGGIGLHPLYVFLAVTFAGFYFGLLGMLLAVPSAAILKILLSKVIRKYLSEAK